jgi:hypothetical protein
MLGAPSNTSALNGASSGDEQQLQDLESLAQRIRALEALLAPATPPPASATTSRAAARASGSGSGIGAGTSSSSLSNGNESPTEDNTGAAAGAEDLVSTSSSSHSPRRVGGDPYQIQPHPSRNHHHNQDQSIAAGSLSRRIQKIETKLWAAAKERKPTEEFLQKCKFLNNVSSFFL